MNRQQAIEMIDHYKNALVNPVMMLHWTWLRVMINCMTDDEWEVLLERAAERIR